MQTTPAIREYFEKLGPKREVWKRRNRFYHSYMQRFINFLVPEGVHTLYVNHPLFKLPDVKEEYDYVVLTDVIGYVYDLEESLHRVYDILKPGGRVILIQYSELWEPVLRLASSLHLRMPSVEQNWLSRIDLSNSLTLVGFDVIRGGSKMIFPKYVPLVSAFLNRIIANIWPFSRLGIFRYVVARRAVQDLTSKKPSISIIVPARNEAGTIEKIARELPELGSFTEIIFIEGNSSDNTYDEIKRVVTTFDGKLGSKILKYGKQEGKGKGDAVRKGFDMATGDILAIYDADMTVPASEVSKFYRAIVTNRAEFINGSRLIYPREKQAMRVLNFFGNKFFSFAFSYIIGQPIKDTLCGTKVLWRKDYEEIKKNRAFFGDFDPFGDFDLLFGAVKLNKKIMDMPVHYKDRVYGTTNISRWSHGWLLLKMTIFAARKLRFI